MVLLKSFKPFEGKELGFRRTGMIRVWCTAEDEAKGRRRRSEGKKKKKRRERVSERLERASVVGFV
jgi:hypothetical protein